jgi:tungsten cofactor oxidoreducase radical SAM maturase
MPGPRKIYLELTNRCNLNCEMCYRQAWHEPLTDMSQGLLDRCIAEIRSIPSIDTVVLGGIGEPTVAPAFPWVLEQLQDKRLIVTTNGTQDDPRLVQAMAAMADQIVVSIDGGAEQFQAIRGYPLAPVVEFIDHLNEARKQMDRLRPGLVFQMTLSEDNAADIPVVLKLAQAKGVERVILSHLLPATEAESERLLCRHYENPAGKALAKATNLLACQLSLNVSIPAMELKTERHCRFVDDESMMILTDGCVVPCYRLAHDGRERVFGRDKALEAHSFGRLSETDACQAGLLAIWDSPAYRRFRKTVSGQDYPSCIDCDLVEGCDMVRSTTVDCNCNAPSCGDCLWARNFIYCV